ncbi:MAG TPA: M50 family metallopeptidase [Micromonosporaceae bacterium]|nr:M50 family metallopeptidase [Micromonosporaceae bacterium]
MLTDLWHRLLERQPIPPPAVIVVTGLLALAAVVPRPVWRLTRGFITIAHEGGHALAAVLSGRRLSGIRLHSDTSGLTLSRGRPKGPGMIITGLAGYVTPPLLGLGGAALLGLGHITALLWLCLALLPLMLIMIRNVYGVISIVVTMAILVAVAGYTPPAVQAAFGYGAVWFLLIGGVRPVFELQRSRRRRQLPDSDADQVGRLTHVPALVWVGFFALVAIGALVLGGRWLLMLAVTD